MTVLALHSVSKSYHGTSVLADISLRPRAGRITAVIGRSGCGKSTLLKLCNGLLRPDSGSIVLFGETLDYTDLPTLRRRIGYAVQGTGLFPHLSIRANITLLAHLEDWPDDAVEERLLALTGLVQLSTDLLDKFPHQLSGGQQQRVGLCRAMMLQPELLLLDEPFAAIDPLTRMDIQQQMLALHRAEPVTTLLVTHDMREALLLADDIVVMANARTLHTTGKSQLLARYPDTEPNQVLLSLMAEETA
jgi:osmoprotectant transport system ATP-binding protein